MHQDIFPYGFYFNWKKQTNQTMCRQNGWDDIKYDFDNKQQVNGGKKIN
jgi:hypothetical protein